MQEKRPVDIKRERSGSDNIGTEEDGAIMDMFNFNGGMLVIKEKSIYEYKHADQIDPRRENPDLPLSSQKPLLSYGSDSEMVCRTFLTAKSLLKPQFIPASIDTTKALLIALDALQEMAAMKDAIDNYLNVEKLAIDEYEDRKGKDVSYRVPTVHDVVTRCKTIFQKSDHVMQALMDIVNLFYPNAGLTKKKFDYNGLLNFLKAEYGELDLFVKFIEQASPFLQLIRALRDGLEHRLSMVVIKDFEQQVNSDINVPSIEINGTYHGSKLARTSLNSFLSTLMENMTTVFELIVAHLCNKNARTDMLTYQVRQIPESQVRRYKYVQYAFWSPIGKDGFYHQ